MTASFIALDQFAWSGDPTVDTLVNCPRTNGNCLVFMAYHDNGQSVANLTQTNVNWQFGHRQVDGSTAVEIWYALNIQSADNEITVDLDAAPGTAGFRVFEYSGVATTDALDIATGGTWGVTDPYIQTGEIMTDHDELCLAALHVNSNSGSLGWGRLSHNWVPRSPGVFNGSILGNYEMTGAIRSELAFWGDSNGISGGTEYPMAFITLRSAAPAFTADIERRQHAFNNVAGASPLVITLPQPIVEGNVIIVAASCTSNASFTGMTMTGVDFSGFDPIRLEESGDGAGSDDVDLELWIGEVTTGGATQLSAAFSINANVCVHVIEYEGLTLPINVREITGDNGNSASGTTGSISAPSGEPSLLFGVLSHQAQAASGPRRAWHTPSPGDFNRFSVDKAAFFTVVGIFDKGQETAATDSLTAIPAQSSKWAGILAAIEAEPGVTEAFFSFRTDEDVIVNPLSVSEELDLSGPGVPAGWTEQSSGTGAAPTYSGSLIPNPGGAGTSYIERTSYGLDFATGFYIDLNLNIDLTASSGPSKSTILRVFQGGIGEITVYIDNTEEPEIGIGTVQDEQVSGSGVSLPFGVSNFDFNIRLSIKGDASDNLVAKLYVEYEQETGRSATTKVLQQTLGPSTNVGTTEDYIQIGKIELGDTAFCEYELISIVNGQDPDSFINSASVDSITLEEGSINGGDIISIVGSNLDAGVIQPTFEDLTWISDQKQGTGTTLTSSGGQLVLDIDSATAAINSRVVAKLGIPLNGLPLSGLEVAFSIDVGSTLITTPPAGFTILAGALFLVNGLSMDVSIVTDSTNGPRILQTIRSGANITRLVSGTVLSSTTLLDIIQGVFNFRFINNNGLITTIINGIDFGSLSLGLGPMSLQFYNQLTTSLVDVNATISNFVVRPYISFGDQIVDNIINIEPDIITLASPANPNTGLQPISLRGPYGNLDVGDFNYTREPQELRIGGNSNIQLYVLNDIIKQALEE